MSLFRVFDRFFFFSFFVRIWTALNNSPYNFQIRLHLLRAWIQIGGFEAAIEHYNSLGVKQIQQDSMSHMLLHDAVELGFFEEARALCYRLCRFHSETNREIPDAIILAFEHGNYSKVRFVFSSHDICLPKERLIPLPFIYLFVT